MFSNYMQNDNVWLWGGPTPAALQIRHSVLWGTCLSRDLNDIRAPVRRLSAERLRGPEGTPHKEGPQTQKASMRQPGLRDGWCI